MSMTRSILDNPSGVYRTHNVSGGTFKPEAGIPWRWDTTLTIDNLASGTYSYIIPDDNYNYIVSMVSVTPQSYGTFIVTVKRTTLEIISNAYTGWANIPVSELFALPFIYGYRLNTTILNRCGSTMTFYLIAHGVKYPWKV